MTMNNLDTWFSKTKFSCSILFFVFSVFYLIGVVRMFACSDAVVQYANSTDYMMLYESEAIGSFIFGKLIFNAMEYMYAGKSILWIIFKSIDPVDVLMMTSAAVILFQANDHVFCASIRVFTAVLVVLGILLLICYGWFLMVASIQLTTEAGFEILRASGEIGRFAGLVLVIMCILMNVSLWVMKK